MTTRNGWFVGRPAGVNEEWLEIFSRRLGAFLIYCGSVLLFCFGLSFVSPKVGAFLFWTLVQGESSYIGWRYLGFHPLRGYLLIVLIVSTLHLIAMWFIFFKGEGPLLDLPLVKRFFNPGRYPRLWATLERKRSRTGLFNVGLIPSVWSIGFLYQREHPMKFGVATVLLGNATKLTVFAVVYSFNLSFEWAFVVIAAIVVFTFALPRVIELLLPKNNRRI